MSDSFDISKIPRFRKGDTLLHDHVNGIVDSIKRDFEFRGPGVRQDGRRIQILPGAQQSSTVSLAIPGSVIASMTGMSPTQGTAVIQRYNSSTGNIESSSETVDVINPARDNGSSTGAIRAGQMCLVFQDSDGTLIIVPIEC